jgi:DNA-binding NarL/FixJ family response regulator
VGTNSFRVLIVDDYEPWRSFVHSTVRRTPHLQVVCQESDGWEAVQKAGEFQPDLIVLDIGLPTLNGVDAARRIRELAPQSKMLFVSQESSADVVQEAFRAGAWGYLVKMDAPRELMTAVDAVLRGEKFIGRRFAGRDFTRAVSLVPPYILDCK